MNYAVKEDLGIPSKYIGNLNINTYGGLIEEQGYQVSANIDGLVAPIDFIVSSCCQNIPFYEYEVPAVWKTKYNLSETPGSACGANMITVGKDNCLLFPTVLEIIDGVCISKSNITTN